ncbi:hypothetical protein [Maricaulis sp.]|uniref:hypothetical protein n=1 Tax=Maricaulis sp. TaxID=1486257 RepID=UPI00260981C4|nr:hypothetical protein [Maricaulis sp.]
MHRFVTALVLSAGPVLSTGLSACVSVGMPDTALEHPDWVEERIVTGDGRGAPPMVPVTSLGPGEEAALDMSAHDLLARRERLNAESGRVLRPQDQAAPSDFVSSGQARTTPPETGQQD